MRRRAFTKKRRQQFLEKLSKSGNVSAAAGVVEVSRQYMYERRDTDKDFAKEWDEAELAFLDAAASEAARRALIGDEQTTTRTLTRKTPEGTTTEDVTETRIVKSDRLLAHMLDRRHPDYRPGRGVSVTLPDGTKGPQVVSVTLSPLDEKL